jgi:hypothetical protein
MTCARSDFLSFPRSTTRKLILCSVHPRNNLFVFKWVGGNSFLSSNTQIPEQAPQEQERRPYIWLAAGVFYSPSCIYNPWCLGDMKFSRIILLVRYIQLGMYARCFCVRFHACQRIYIKLYLFCWDSSRCTLEQSENLNSISHGSLAESKYAAVPFVFKPKSTLLQITKITPHPDIFHVLSCI